VSSFNESYFIGGAESNYIDYNTKQYDKLAFDIFKIMKLKKDEIVLDYGCATGILTKALNKYTICYGTDISNWAINYGIKQNKFKSKLLYYNYQNIFLKYNFVHKFVILDVLEHCKLKEIKRIFNNIKSGKCRILVRIPVSAVEGDDYLLECSKKDKTHIQCHSKTWWHKLFLSLGFDVCQIVRQKTIYDSDGVLVWILKRK